MQIPCAGFSKTGAWYRVPSPGYLAPGTRDRINAGDRTPSTEDRAKHAHRVCMMGQPAIPRVPYPVVALLPDCLTA